MNVFLHVDKCPGSKQWHSMFRKLLLQRGHSVTEIELPQDFYILKKRCGPEDFFVGRIKHQPRKKLIAIQAIYDELCDLFEDRCFPCRQSLFYYDDKEKQLNLFQDKGYPIPDTVFARGPQDVAMPFPLICKKIFGASSKCVTLARSVFDIDFPCILQEFCEGNDGDIRINVIGERVMGYARANRPGDFRASGSGLLSYPTDFDKPCVDIAYNISKENGFDSMAYDFLKRKGEWVVLEMSYTYVDKYVLDCPFYYEMKTGMKINKEGIYPEEMILDDLMPRLKFL